eukprot:1303403-Prymnesium_polylepis.1
MGFTLPSSPTVHSSRPSRPSTSTPSTTVPVHRPLAISTAISCDESSWPPPSSVTPPSSVAPASSPLSSSSKRDVAWSPLNQDEGYAF